jgi:predicted nucleic acid-binding protein
MSFWDASAVVPLILDEAGMCPTDSWYPTDPIIVWWGTLVEVTSAIVRRERAGSLSLDGVAGSLTLLSDMASRWVEIPPSERLRDRARRLLRTHGLRTADGLQLAAALTAANDDPSRLDFICRDSRLAEAAAREGLRVRAA